MSGGLRNRRICLDAGELASFMSGLPKDLEIAVDHIERFGYDEIRPVVGVGSMVSWDGGRYIVLYTRDSMDEEADADE